MSDKPNGIDFDRQVFIRPQARTTRPESQAATLFLALAVIAAIAFLGYELLTRVTRESTNAGNPELADLDKRLTTIEERLEKLETTRRVALPVKKEESTEPIGTAPKPAAQTIYQISPPQRQRGQTTAAPGPDPTVAHGLSTLQQGLGALQSSDAANREAWQATTDKLADMSGRVGTQGVDILRSQDELNQLLARTEMEAIPFELRRGSNPQPVGPVSLALKSTNQKAQQYTLCVYFQPICIELKGRTLHEVVQFVVSRNTSPLEVIATKITKDVMLGYLEIPRTLIGIQSPPLNH